MQKLRAQESRNHFQEQKIIDASDSILNTLKIIFFCFIVAKKMKF